MDNFWKWLKRANARAVFFCLLVALVGVGGWWVWKLSKPVRMPITPVSLVQERSNPPLGLLAYLDAQRASASNPPPEALLFPAPLPKIVEPKIVEPKIVEPKIVEPKVVEPKIVEPKVVEPKVVAPLPPPPKEITQLVYRGMMRRGDGSSVALIWDSKSKQAVFYPMGTNVFGLKLQAIGPESLSVDLADGSMSKLKRGVPCDLPGGTP